VIVVVGVGNVYRGDDAAGVLVADGVRADAPPGVDVRVCELEPTRLVEALRGAEAAFLADAVSSGAEPGTVHRHDAGAGALPADLYGGASTHAFGLADAVELARALAALPSRLLVFGIEGRAFAAGDEVTPAVAEAAARVADQILAEIAAS
jgi:hydrogenase maturation protease